MGNHGGVDIPHSDWGDFRRRRAADISSCIHDKVWDDITYPLSNFNNVAVKFGK